MESRANYICHGSRFQSVGWENMLSCRMRWYVLETSRLLRRYWQALLLSVMLLLPAMPVFAQTQILGAPVLEAVVPSRGVEWQLVWVHMLEAIGVLWVLAQRTAIGGGAFGAFVRSLPIADGRRRAVDIAMVLMASTPLLLPVLAAAIALAFLPQKLGNYLFVLDLTLITLGWQLTVLSWGTRNAAPLIVANVVLVGASQAGEPIRPALLLIPLVLAAWAIAHTPSASVSRRSVGLRAFARRATSWTQARIEFGLSPLMKLQIGIVRDRAAAAFGRYLTMGSVAASTCFLLKLWGYDARVVPLTLISQAAIALIAAATYRDLRAAHLRAAHFTFSLPVASTTVVCADMLTVAALALPFASIAPLLLVAHGVLTGWTTGALLFSGAPLVVALYLPQRYAPRQSIVLGVVLATMWVALAWQIFV